MSKAKRRRAGKPKQHRKILHKPVAVDTAFLPWPPGLGPAFPRDSAGGQEGRTTARGRGCSAASESEGYCPCRTTEVSSWPLGPLGCPVVKHKQRNTLRYGKEMVRIITLTAGKLYVRFLNALYIKYWLDIQTRKVPYILIRWYFEQWVWDFHCILKKKCSNFVLIRKDVSYLQKKQVW